MKRAVISLFAAVMILGFASSVSKAANQDAGGVKGFFTGCCFGLRTGADYNDMGTGKRDFIAWFFVGACCGVRAQEDYRDGKDITFRDWAHIIPYIGFIFNIWDGIDVAGGKTRKDLQQAYGASYY